MMHNPTDAGRGTNVAAAWQKVVKLLQDCSTKQPGKADAALSDVQKLLRRLATLPPAPKAVWKKLVQQQKVSEEAQAVACKLSMLTECAHSLTPALDTTA
jgi:hypothetical protein